MIRCSRRGVLALALLGALCAAAYAMTPAQWIALPTTSAMAPGQLASGAACSPDWLPTFDGFSQPVGPVRTLAVYDDGAGPALYAGGVFSSPDGVLQNIARWDGLAWSPLGMGTSMRVNDLAVLDSGAGPELYLGGELWPFGGHHGGAIASWDGSSWSPKPLDFTGLKNTSVLAVAGFDDGTGPALYIGGDFWWVYELGAGTAVLAAYVVRWDPSGGALSPLVGDVAGTNGSVWALTVFDDGSGPALYLGGTFTQAGGQPANRVVRWDGLGFLPLGSGTNGAVVAFAVHDDGSGPALYAGGYFTEAGGLPASHVARWDGSAWSALGSGTDAVVLALSSFTAPGVDPLLVAGGEFTSAGGTAASRIAAWNGSSWSALGTGVSARVRALASFDDGTGPAIFVGGEFTSSPGGDGYVAKWGCTDPGLVRAYCFGDGGGTPCPCGNSTAPGAGGCANSTGQGGALFAGGSASLGAADLVLVGAGLIPGSMGIYFQADHQLQGGLGMPFGDGLQCAGGAGVRLEAQLADTFGDMQTTVDVGAAGSVTAGTTKQYQLLYRDPLQSPCGSGLNLTNALSIAWQP